MATVTRAGVVLAGGHSRRFGEADKALASIDGKPMLVHVVERLAAVAGDVVVSCRAEQRPAFKRVLERALDPVDASVDYVPDPVPGEGPLAGLHASLEAVSTEYVAVVACDMPAVDPTFVDGLFDDAAGRDGAVPRLRNGTLQPTQAVYRTVAIERACARELASGNRSLHGALDRLDVRILSPSDVEARTDWRSLTNVNTEAERARLEQ